VRAEIARTLLDLSAASRADRLRHGRDLVARAAEMAAALKPSDARAAAKTGRARRGAPESTRAEGQVDGDADAEAPAAGPAIRVPAAERRAAALGLVAIWRDVVRDLALVAMGAPGDVRQVDLLDDLETAAARLPKDFAPAQLRRLDVAGERLEGNVSPELVIDALALGWTA
jgi:hypothetical protein